MQLERGIEESRELTDHCHRLGDPYIRVRYAHAPGLRCALFCGGRGYTHSHARMSPVPCRGVFVPFAPCRVVSGCRVVVDVTGGCRLQLPWQMIPLSRCALPPRDTPGDTGGDATAMSADIVCAVNVHPRMHVYIYTPVFVASMTCSAFCIEPPLHQQQQHTHIHIPLWNTLLSLFAFCPPPVASWASTGRSPLSRSLPV